VPRDLDWAGLHEFAYFGSTLGTQTLLSHVSKVESGTWLSLDREGSHKEAFWRVEDTKPVHDNIETATARVRALFEASVKRHLISDVPVGAFLSGGVDSSAVTLVAARSAKLSTYSVSFDFDPGELPRAKLVASRAGTDHHEIAIRGPDIAETIRALVRQHDQPFGDAANVPLYLLAQRLGGSPKVVLQGDGGDEMFAGYRRYNVLAFVRLWQAVARARPVLDRLPQSRTQQRLQRFLRAVGDPDPARRMALLLTEDPETPSPMRLFGEAARERATAFDPFARYRELAVRLRHLPEVQRMLHTDTRVLLPDIFCEKVDRSTMAHSLEVRLPFLDNELTDYVLGLPSTYKVRRLEKKWLLRRTLRGVVPDQVLDAPKRGFGVPYGEWLRGPLRRMLEESVLEGRAQKEGLLDRNSCHKVIDEHVSGRQGHGFLLYKALNFALWYEAYG
jgi:asparagine synthase (glutamine-hydrolysing)